MKLTTNNDSTVTIAGEIPYEELAKHRAAAIAHLGKNVELDGFRKGHVPPKILEERLGAMTILTEMAERALAKTYPQIITTYEIDAIGYPQISITKLAPDNPLGFSAKVAVMPKVTLPDYVSIATQTPLDETAAVVSDTDIDDAIKNVLRQKAAYDRIQQKAAQQATTDATDLPTPETVAAPDTDTEPELPKLTDELVKSLGAFETVEAFKTKIREELTEQKAQEAKNKHRAALSDAVVEATELTLPELLIEAEQEQFLAQMREDLKRAQLSMDDYLAHINKTEADLKAEWRPAAEKRAKVQIILDAIADAEKIEPDQTLVNEQVASLKAQYPDADESRVQTYVASILRNEAVMKLLEEKSTN